MILLTIQKQALEYLSDGTESTIKVLFLTKKQTMRYKLSTLALCVLLSFAAQGQQKKEKVLLEIDEQPVYQSEFIR